MHIRSLALALLLSTTAASAASVSDFSLVDNGDGSVTLSWTVSGSSGMFYRGYNVAVSRGTSPNQAASTRTLVEGDSGSYMTQQGTTGNVRDAPPATGETYYYWLHYSNYSIINDTENFFFNYLGGSPGTILSAPCTGPRSYQSSGGEETLEAPESVTAVTGDTVVTVVVSWSAVDGAESYQVYAGRTDSFDAASPIQMSVADTTLSYAVPAASVNAMPDYFWVVAKKGTIESDPSPAARWTRTPQTLPVTAKALSADVSAGSITIGWDDPDVVVPAGLTFTLYRKTEDDPGTAVSTGVSGPGPSFVDTGFGSIGGTSPVYYYIVNDQGLYSTLATGKTRVRRGLFVGQNVSDGFVSDARLCRQLAVSQGGFDGDNCFSLLGGDATVSSIQGEMAELASLAKPGDFVFIYLASHGYEGGGSLAFPGNKNGYTVVALQRDVRSFDPGVVVVGVVMACFSGSMSGTASSGDGISGALMRAGLANCQANIAWITSCGYDESSLLFGNASSSPTPFGVSFLRNGWELGHADRHLYGTDWSGGDSNGEITLLELALYAREFSKGYSDQALPSGVETDNDSLLGRMGVGVASQTAQGARPVSPSTCQASQGTKDSSIDVSWSLPSDASIERYWLFRSGPGESGGAPVCISRYAGQGSFNDARTIFSKLPKDAVSGVSSPRKFGQYRYFVKSVGPSGVSEASPVATGYAGTPGLLEWFNRFGFDSEESFLMADVTKAANGVDSVFDCYVAGLDPTKADDRLRATISMSSGAPDIRPSPDLGAARVYTVMGKTNLADEAWVAPTNASHRFFQVKVELPEE